jgi:DNA repair protein RadD
VTVQLRAYQQRAIDELRRAYQNGKRAPCLVCPTGAGKTVIAAAIIDSAVRRGNRVLFLAHREELIAQTVAKLATAGVHDVRVIRAGSDLGDPCARVVVASIPTLTRWKSHLPDAQLVVFDEAHHVKANTWTSIADKYRSARLLGLTATPQRADGKALGDIFDAIVLGSTVAELTKLGHLVPCHVWAPSEKLEPGDLAISVAEAHAKYGAGRRTVVFFAKVDAAEEAARQIGAEVVHGKLSKAVRASILARFASGQLLTICNVGVLTEGWDCPAAEVCILARQPEHAGLFLQIVGRVLRPSPGKTSALLVDLGGSVHEHGTPDCTREFTLGGRGISASGREPIRQCPTCGACFLVAVDGRCPMCGAEMPTRVVNAPQSIDVGLVDVTHTAKPMLHWAKFAARMDSICPLCRGFIAKHERIAWRKGERARHERCHDGGLLDVADALLGAS